MASVVENPKANANYDVMVTAFPPLDSAPGLKNDPTVKAIFEHQLKKLVAPTSGVGSKIPYSEEIVAGAVSKSANSKSADAGNKHAAEGAGMEATATPSNMRTVPRDDIPVIVKSEHLLYTIYPVYCSSNHFSQKVASFKNYKATSKIRGDFC
jgi:hypothetical protein